MIRPLILFDLTRLLSASGRSAPTGIERVEFAYARWLLRLSGVHVRFVVTMKSSVRLVANEEVPDFLARQARTWAGGAQGFPAHRAILNINRFLRGAGGPPAPRFGYLSREERQQRREQAAFKPSASSHRPIANWAQQMAANWAREPLEPMLRRSTRRRPVVYLRASMDRMERAPALERLKAFEALRMVALCHDIIPLDFPEFVRPSAVAQCASRVETMGRLADGIIVSSDYSARRLAHFLPAPRPKLTVAHIGIDTPAAAPPADLPALEDVPFFLVISTIEARKNHALLLNVWRQMVEDLGDAAPKLVIAGKRGWEAQTPLAMLDRSRQLAGHVYEAGAVPDAALDVLRRRATAVLMPSFVEGFGMPVMEALAVKTPVIASDIPVFREVAGRVADLVDPLDGPAWRSAIMDYAAPRSARRAAALQRAQRYAPPSWDDYFQHVQSFIDEIIEQPALSLAQKARRAIGSVAFAPGDVPVPARRA